MALSAKELRIGNYINAPHGDVQIEYFTEIGAHFIDGNGGTFASLRPIPLTEEWLLKFGLKPMKCISFDWKTEYIIKPNKCGWSIGVLLCDYPEDNPNCGCVSILEPEDIEVSGVPPDLCSKENWTKEDIKRAEHYTVKFNKWRQPIAYYIKYVHQLQNLYFALAGEELTIKNDKL